MGDLTYLFCEHAPFELRQVLHGPHVVPPAGTLLPTNGLCIQHLRHRSRNFLVFELYPAFCEVHLLRGSELSAKIRSLGIYSSYVSSAHEHI